LPLRIPALDNCRFEEVLGEARARIPCYAPEWTDYNDNDPGVLLIQLFAWAAGTILVRPHLVPRCLCTRFLGLMGVVPRPTQCAGVEVTFRVTEAHLGHTVIVPEHTRVAAVGALSEEPVVFEVREALMAGAAHLEQVWVFSDHGYADVTQRNQDAREGFAPLGVPAREGNALLMGFGCPRGVGKSEELAQIGLDITFTIRALTARHEPPTGSPSDSSLCSSARLVWEHWNGEAWQSLTVEKDTTRALTRSGHVVLRRKGQWRLSTAMTLGRLPAGLFWIRARIDHGAYECAPVVETICINAVGAVHAATQRDEVVGGSNGTPSQVFRTAHGPLLTRTMDLEVDEGDGFQVWEEVSSLAASEPRDRHYVVRASGESGGEILFGDGERGRIPRKNPANLNGNIIARTYRYGGGRRGNVGAGAVKTLLDSIPGIDADRVTNPRPATGGADAETLEEARCRAPVELRNKCRAMIGDWLEALAKEVCHVRRAKAMSLTHPGVSGRSVPGAATVIVVPDSHAPTPLPDKGMLRAVHDQLQCHPLCTELYVVPPSYHLVRVRTHVIAEEGWDLAEIKRVVEGGLLRYLHPLTGGERGAGWEFGGVIRVSSLYEQILLVPGVCCVHKLAIAVDGKRYLPGRDVRLPPDGLVYSGHHEVLVTYGTQAGTPE
jgi:predicted phage baseplate assembly protein